MLSTTKRRIGAIAATAALAAVGIGATATSASAATVTNKPYLHHFTVETKNVHVHQHNWIRKDTDATSGPSIRNYWDGEGFGGVYAYAPSTEITAGQIRISDSDLTVSGANNTVHYAGGSKVWVHAEVSTDSGRTYDPINSEMQVWNLQNHQRTGWNHIKASTGNGDYLEFDYQITNDAQPLQ